MKAQLSEFLEHMLLNENASAHTVRAYESDLTQFVTFTAKEAERKRYELTPDAHFVAAPHPDRPVHWLLGGGSGHGFKHGPALADAMIGALRDGASLPAHFALGERVPGGALRTAGSGAQA